VTHSQRAAAAVLALALAVLAAPTARAQPGYPGLPTPTFEAPGQPGGTPGFGDPFAVQTAVPFSPAMPTPFGGEPSFGSPFAAPTQVPFNPGIPTPFGGAAPTMALPGAMPGAMTPVGLGGAPTPAGSAPRAVLPEKFTVGAAPVALEVGVAGAPELSGFQLTLAYPPGSVAPIGAAPGTMVTGAGGTVQPLTINLSTPGTVTYGLSLADATRWPSGDGPLVRITFAPLAKTETATLQVVDLALVGRDGQRLSAAPASAALVVTAQPDATEQAAVASTVTALALATPDPSGAVGTNVSGGANLASLFTGGGAVLGWLVALFAGLAIATFGWMMGRRPAA
jgi:hypothetical protein